MVDFFFMLDDIYTSLDNLLLVILMFMGFVVSGWIISAGLLAGIWWLERFFSGFFNRKP
jgi:hypothetical protein